MTDDRPTAGDVLDDRYHLLERLGRGGMAEVYWAQDLVRGDDVAVKLFRDDVAEALDPSRTRREMAVLADVRSSSLVRVLNASPRSSQTPYLVLELVVGCDLGALLHRGPVEPERVRRIVGDVAAALAELHAHGLVHRDVKPANILVPDHADPDQPAAKLTDFGILRVVDATRVTATGSILGTAAYLSPEQVQGGHVGAASDVYGLGLVLVEAMTGRRAYPGGLAESAVARLHRPPALPPTASPRLAHLLSAMTALDPDSRPVAGEVADRLRALAGAMTAETADGTLQMPAFVDPLPVAAAVPVRSTRPAGIRLVGAAAAVAVTLSAGIGLVFAEGSARTPTGADAAAAAPQHTPTALPAPSAGAPAAIAARPTQPLMLTASLTRSTPAAARRTGSSPHRSTTGHQATRTGAPSAPTPKRTAKGHAKHHPKRGTSHSKGHKKAKPQHHPKSHKKAHPKHHGKAKHRR